MALLTVGAGFPYSTIQAAVTAQGTGGSVRVMLPAVGTAYPEMVTIASKRIRLYSPLVAADGKPLLSITGAGGGASAAVVSTGTGGVHLENFKVSNVGSASTLVVTGINMNDYYRRLIIDGNAGAQDCLRSNLADSCILQNGRYGINSNYNAAGLWRHLTLVNMSTAGWNFPCGAGVIQACLAQNCNGVSFPIGTSLDLDGCCWNLSDDLTVPGVNGFPLTPLADVAFVNYAGGDFFLTLNSAAWVPGIDFVSMDITGKRIARDLEFPRIYIGAHDPSPAAPSWITGTSTIRSM